MEDGDIVDLLRDLAYVIDSTHDQALFHFLTGAPLLEAAETIERLRIISAEQDAEIQRLSQLAQY